MMMQVKDGISREMANQQFGEQVVTAALQELMKVRQHARRATSPSSRSCRRDIPTARW